MALPVLVRLVYNLRSLGHLGGREYDACVLPYRTSFVDITVPTLLF
jgi:hypothetical protein